MSLGTKPPGALPHPANNKQTRVPLRPPQQGAYCEPSENKLQISRKIIQKNRKSLQKRLIRLTIYVAAFDSKVIKSGPCN